ncbi:transcriptional regulator [Clostridium botulinum]|nr:transcriptional regulator [Clostridium botulinum]NFT58413.1 transcriptional regulator [Clostridium botulinum]
MRMIRMSKLVFLDKNNLNEEPFTISKIIAEYGQVEHHALQQLILKYEDDIKEFGVIAFEMRKPENSKGGRPEKIYKLNEEQSTLLISYMQNTLPVRNFKKKLVKEFYLMKKELSKRVINREKAKDKRNALTDAINRMPDSPHKAMKYRHFTDLVYKIVFNKNTKQLREEFQISKDDTPRDYFSANELEKVEVVENQIAVLISLGNDYLTIKDMLQKKYLISA